ncbi:MAG: tripartite tricarboxylate transporter TctB family protein [Granulosicoccus sp.]|nr:tripartite tricarboxylate transporter TctB family protein [Granulosicoccus sp.]
MSSDRITGIIIVFLGLATFFVLIPKGIVVPGNLEVLALSPDFWPRIVAVMFTLCGLVMCLQNHSAPSSDSLDIPVTSRIPRLAITLAALFGFYFAIPKLGMVAPAILLIFGMMFFSGERRWGLMIITAIFAPVLLYVFFVYVANIPIPLGVFEALRG